MAAVFPALGLEWAAARLAKRGWRWAGGWVIGSTLGISAVWGICDYWWRYARNPDLAYRFEADQVQEAVEINRFLGTGWQGVGLREPAGELVAGRHVYLAPRLWESRLSVNFMVVSPDQISILGRDPPVEADEVLVLAWPHEDMRRVRQVLPHPARIGVWPGPLERGDLDAQARLLYVAYRATLRTGSSQPIARFEEGIELLGWDVEPGDGGRLRLHWQVTQPLSTDYTVFVHLVRAGQVVAQADGVPGYGFYPTTWWEPGDEIVDDHLIDVGHDSTQRQIVIGWYEFGSMRHLRVWEEDGQLGADRVVLE